MRGSSAASAAATSAGIAVATSEPVSAVDGSGTSKRCTIVQSRPSRRHSSTCTTSRRPGTSSVGLPRWFPATGSPSPSASRSRQSAANCGRRSWRVMPGRSPRPTVGPMSARSEPSARMIARPGRSSTGQSSGCRRISRARPGPTTTPAAMTPSSGTPSKVAGGEAHPVNPTTLVTTATSSLGRVDTRFRRRVLGMRPR